MDTIFLDHHDRKFWNFSPRHERPFVFEFASMRAHSWFASSHSKVSSPPFAPFPPVHVSSPHRLPGQIRDQQSAIRNMCVHTLFTLRSRYSRFSTLFHAIFCGGGGGWVTLISYSIFTTSQRHHVVPYAGSPGHHVFPRHPRFNLGDLSFPVSPVQTKLRHSFRAPVFAQRTSFSAQHFSGAAVRRNPCLPVVPSSLSLNSQQTSINLAGSSLIHTPTMPRDPGRTRKQLRKRKCSPHRRAGPLHHESCSRIQNTPVCSEDYPHMTVLSRVGKQEDFRVVS
jgi:hypothetical protein